MKKHELMKFAAMATSYVTDGDVFWDTENDKEWDPLESRVDAFRLAVRLGMNLSTNLHHRFVVANDEQIFYDESKFGGACDPDGAMCRAIVQAAAKIGKQMEAK